ncbi:hypothetical protein FRB99_008414 [Tulasnella sp. 403]|nr:hypothetical protein FRB99_008414 [Tulasnella sp. 403]
MKIPPVAFVAAVAGARSLHNFSDAGNAVAKSHTLAPRGPGSCPKISWLPVHWNPEGEEDDTPRKSGCISCLPISSKERRKTSIQLKFLSKTFICAYDVKDGWGNDHDYALALTPLRGLRHEEAQAALDDWTAQIELLYKLGDVYSHVEMNSHPWAVVRRHQGLLLTQTARWTEFFNNYDPSRASPEEREECEKFIDGIHEAVVDKKIWYAVNRGMIFDDLDYYRIIFTDGQDLSQMEFVGWIPKLTSDWAIGRDVSRIVRIKWKKSISRKQISARSQHSVNQFGEATYVKGFCYPDDQPQHKASTDPDPSGPPLRVGRPLRWKQPEGDLKASFTSEDQ